MLGVEIYAQYIENILSGIGEEDNTIEEIDELVQKGRYIDDIFYINNTVRVGTKEKVDILVKDNSIFKKKIQNNEKRRMREKGYNKETIEYLEQMVDSVEIGEVSITDFGIGDKLDKIVGVMERLSQSNDSNLDYLVDDVDREEYKDDEDEIENIEDIDALLNEDDDILNEENDKEEQDVEGNESTPNDKINEESDVEDNDIKIIKKDTKESITDKLHNEETYVKQKEQEMLDDVVEKIEVIEEKVDDAVERAEVIEDMVEDTVEKEEVVEEIKIVEKKKTKKKKQEPLDESEEMAQFLYNIYNVGGKIANKIKKTRGKGD